MEPQRAVQADEGRLIERIRQGGDTAAFVTLMRRHNLRVFRIARSILPDDAEAEDATQEAWLLAHRRLHQFEGRSSFGGWLSRIVAREALARARRRRPVLVEHLVESVVDTHSSPERQAYDREARAMLEGAIDTLPEAFRAVFVMREIEEMSVAETAACLEIPEDTVKTRLHRARRMLREVLAERLDAASGEVFAFAGERCDRIVQRVLARLAS